MKFKKIFLVFLVFALFILFNINISNANYTTTFTDVDGTDNNLILSDFLSNNYNYIYLLSRYDSYSKKYMYQLYFSNSEMYFDISESSSSFTYNIGTFDNSTFYKAAMNYFESPDFSFVDSLEPTLSGKRYFETYDSEYGFSTLLYTPVFSTYNLCDKNNELVFQVAPLTTTILPEIMEQVEMKGVLKEILEILPIVLIIVVSLVAFWKGFHLLSQILRNS